MAANNLPYSSKLVGKEFTLRYERNGVARQYRFQDPNKLSYRDEGENQWREADYRCYEPDKNLFWFSHFLSDSKPRACSHVVVDLDNGLTTNLHSWMGTPYYTEVRYKNEAKTGISSYI